MPQIGQVQLSGLRSASLPSLFPFQSRGKLNPMQIETIAEPQVCRIDNVQQSTSPMDGIRAEALASEEEDVQIIFCAPRRKKKRRKRLESAHLESPVSQATVELPTPEIHHVHPRPPRRRSIGVVQRLELCHIGEEKSPSGRAESLPSIPCATNNISTVQYPWFAEPSYSGTSSAQFPSLTDSTAWCDQSLPTLQPRPLPSIPWRPICADGPNPLKRKHDDDLHETARLSCSRRSVQMSPRATPDSEFLPLIFPPHANSHHFDMYVPGQYFATSPNWPSNECNAFDIGHHYYEPAMGSGAALLMDTSTSEIASTAKLTSHGSSVSNMIGGAREKASEASHEQADQTKAVMPSCSDLFPNIESAQLPGSGEQLHPGAKSPAPNSNPHASSPSSGILTLNNINDPHASPLGAFAQPGRQETPSHASTAPVPSRNTTRVAQSPDILRKPSLYSIPPWPTPRESLLSRTPIVATHSHARSRISNSNDSSASDIEVRQTLTNQIRSSPHLPNAVAAHGTNTETRLESTSTAPTKAAIESASREPCGSNASTFRIPKARLGRKHSPNLIVDVAETCQEIFPFAEVAERHEVPIQKVFDTFSAIIQLPLLRNADDRRRHGSLGKRRMKGYRDAKKAMERAQEAERKAQMKDIRTRVEDAARGKEGRDQPLLRSAVLNNAREFQRTN